MYSHQWEVLEGIDASRRVGWAKYFDEHEAREQAEMLNATMLSVLYDLADAVLDGRKFEAFGIAFRVRGNRRPNPRRT